MSEPWTSKRILKEIADDDRRRNILGEFWRHGEASAKILATAQLARALKFREESIRKMPIEKKSDLLAARAGTAEFEQFIDFALMQYHTSHQSEMMGKFLDAWSIPHENGSIEADEYKTPSTDEVKKAVSDVGASYDRRDVALYLATAGLLMGEDWRTATWPAVDELMAG